MATGFASERALVDALDEPALVIEGNVVRTANAEARHLLGSRIEGRDVRLAIRHPQALEQILTHRSGEIDATGIVELGRSWRLLIRQLGDRTALVRMIDRSDAVSAEKMRVDFVANASHELRTPLSTILGYAETIAEDADLPAELRSSFGGTIRDEARRMLRIIEDLMSLSRIEADRYRTPDEEIDLGEVARIAIEHSTILADRRGCRIEAQIGEAIPVLKGDFGQLLQLSDNLIGNAIRYGCNEKCSAIWVKVAGDGHRVLLTVKDGGDGIAPQHLPRLTERFYRVDSARSRESGGTGLGLAIVKHIVERHRGEMRIDSAPGQGTEVTISLPVE